MPQSKFFRIVYGTIGILVIILLLIKINVIYVPLLIIFNTLFLPFLLSGVLFYLFRPIVNYLESKNMPRMLAIIILFVSLTIVIGGGIYLGAPLLQSQLNEAIEKIPGVMESAIDEAEQLKQEGERKLPFSFDQAINRAEQRIFSWFQSAGENAMQIIGAFINTMVAVFVTPFILFYLLKDGSHFPNIICRFLSKHNELGIRKILTDMDEALGSYIRGQVIVSFCVGVLMYIGYLIIGLDFSLILAVFALLTNVMPFVGPIIGALPAVFVALMHSPIMAVKVLVVVLIVQQLEGNLISPQVMGKTLHIHPLTVILLLLVAGALGGILGMIVAIPTYAVLKVIIRDSYRIYQLRNDDVPF